MRATWAGLASAVMIPALVVIPSMSAGAADSDDEAFVESESYVGDPTSEALLVAGEDRRLIDIRAISNAATWTGASQFKPYRLVTGNTYTLVLTDRDAAYSFDDLRELSPRTLVRQPDGSYLLSENIVVEEGATLSLRSDDGLILRMVSNPDAFVSIVTMGGSLTIEGTPEEPVEVSSWDPDTGTVDSDTSDGRAYIRVIGGHAGLGDASFHHLGFWAGMTGGVSLTGTELPEVSDRSSKISHRDDDLVETEVESNPTVYGSELIPAGEELTTLSLEPDLSGYSYVSAAIRSVTFSDNAFGLFVTSAEGVDVRDSVIENSLVDGLVFHRHVTNSRVTSTSSTNNAVDGFAMSRASTGVIFDKLTATGNGRNGIAVDGRPLAAGPSATGSPTGTYGNNEISSSTSKNNGHYGIDVLGGTNLTLASNSVSDNEMGIVVRGGVETVVVKNNLVENSDKQGIALRDTVTGATVQGNTVVGGDIGIYLRDAYGLVDRNVIEDVGNHAITLIGTAAVTTISNNTVSGTGPSAIDVSRARDTVLEDNNAEEWRSTKPLDVILRGIFQPLTVMWLSLGLLVVITAITGIRRKRTGIVHPYANLAPLSSLTKGVVSPREAGIGVEHRVTPISLEARAFGDPDIGPAT